MRRAAAWLRARAPDRQTLARGVRGAVIVPVAFAVARALRERSEESRRRRERDLAFGLVADDAEPIRNVDTPRGLREKPALADTGIPDDERRHRPADRGARDGLDKRLELGGPAHEGLAHGSSVDRSKPLRIPASQSQHARGVAVKQSSERTADAPQEVPR